MRRHSPRAKKTDTAWRAALLLCATIALCIGGISDAPAQKTAAADVAYVEDVKGRVRAQGIPTPLDALDVLGEQAKLQVEANGQVRLCHYRMRRIFDMAGPLRAVVTTSGVTSESGKRIDPTTETCAAPLISTFQGGIVTRSALAATNVPLRPRIKIINRGTNPIRKVALWDSAQRAVVANFNHNTARPVLDHGQSYVLVVEQQDGGQLKMLLQASDATHTGPLIVVIR